MASAQLLGDLRAARADWANGELGPRTTLWQGLADWPRPDIAFQDKTTNAAIALEFKPPNQPKREYVTGIGQAITYLNTFKYSGLIVPSVANDGFHIADYIGEIFSGLLSQMPIVLFGYDSDPAKLRVIRKLQKRSSGSIPIPAGTGRTVFWGYWRDLSNYDLLTLMQLIDSQKRPNFRKAFDNYWSRFATKGRALTWERRIRKSKAKLAASRNGERINANLAMKHSGLISSDDRLTGDGYKLLQIGKVYGPQSIAFLEALAAQVLIEARHLELMLWIDEQQRYIHKRKKRDAREFYRAVDARLATAGIIAAPKSGAAKVAFIRDEPKLWNKLGLLISAGVGRYFHAGYGLVIDWRKVISVVQGK